MKTEKEEGRGKPRIKYEKERMVQRQRDVKTQTWADRLKEIEERDRQTQRQRARESWREIDRQTDRQTDRDRETEETETFRQRDRDKQRHIFPERKSVPNRQREMRQHYERTW